MKNLPAGKNPPELINVVVEIAGKVRPRHQRALQQRFLKGFERGSEHFGCIQAYKAE